ncbi:uncharacterized protein ATC70_008153 [Mucor velutinosus]|uniref:Uncharacterized protein n=1 Tax=Mucor velutinosus TaxID=708070 RepID=A0AAN7HVI4_9FUNG|nr:hypothetical protein ATC70_008153 [Mucor velutinosus]
MFGHVGLQGHSCKNCNHHYGKGYFCADDGASGSSKLARRISKIQPIVDKTLATEAGAAVLMAKSKEVSDTSIVSSVDAPVVDEVGSGTDTDSSSMEQTRNIGTENLCSRAQASLVDGMDDVSVADAESMQNMAAQERKLDALLI